MPLLCAKTVHNDRSIQYHRVFRIKLLADIIGHFRSMTRALKSLHRNIAIIFAGSLI